MAKQGIPDDVKQQVSRIVERFKWMFPCSDLVDGTVEGALKAGLEAYP